MLKRGQVDSTKCDETNNLRRHKNQQKNLEGIDFIFFKIRRLIRYISHNLKIKNAKNFIKIYCKFVVPRLYQVALTTS